MLRSLSHPLYALPFALPVHEALESEYRTMTRSARARAVRKLWQREALLHATGQAARRVERVAAGTRRLLWLHTWTTVGDAILDLAARSLVPASIELELCIAPALAPLFRGDARFARVHVDPAACTTGHDFVLLDGLSTASIRLKTRHFPTLPFASLRGHLLGERFDRAAFGDRRIRQLFDLDPGPVVAPWLSVRRPAETRRSGVVVALGARVEAKRYRRWPEVLEQVVAAWPANVDLPRFRLSGTGPQARDDLRGFAPGFLREHCEVAVDRDTSIGDAAAALAASHAFVGIDGGLMHIAVAAGVPGLAVFTSGTDPAFFLRPASTVQALRAPSSLGALGPGLVAERVLERLLALRPAGQVQGCRGDFAGRDVADLEGS